MKKDTTLCAPLCADDDLLRLDERSDGSTVSAQQRKGRDIHARTRPGDVGVQRNVRLTQSEAMQREAAKKLTRPRKQVLIDSQNGGELLTVYDETDAPAENARGPRACASRPTMCATCGWSASRMACVRPVAAAAAADRPLFPAALI